MAVLAVFSLVYPVSASRIQMGVSLVPEGDMTGGSFAMNLTILNSGDEAAHDVQASLLLPDGFSSEPIYAGTMDPQVPVFGAFRVLMDGSVNPGLYPIVLKTHYTDANAYPFSTVAPSFLRYKTSAPVMMRGEVGNVTLAGQAEKTIEVRFDNLDDKPHDALIRLMIPDEMKAAESSKRLRIGPKESGRVSFPLKSFGALPGSVYVVFATAEYDEAGLHYASIASGRVEIVAEEKGGLEAPPWLPAGILALLLIIVIYLQVRK